MIKFRVGQAFPKNPNCWDTQKVTSLKGPDLGVISHFLEHLCYAYPGLNIVDKGDIFYMGSGCIEYDLLLEDKRIGLIKTYYQNNKFMSASYDGLYPKCNDMPVNFIFGKYGGRKDKSPIDQKVSLPNN
ncbi:MAG: hypothetical protein JW727_01085 [Candidatus Aenigmarchaeota archaeon]|nr:hypothetical protein [Candidatus Aenigmarchaeota archaeon]